jgi:hypothetical protein
VGDVLEWLVLSILVTSEKSTNTVSLRTVVLVTRVFVEFGVPFNCPEPVEFSPPF